MRRERLGTRRVETPNFEAINGDVQRARVLDAGQHLAALNGHAFNHRGARRLRLPDELRNADLRPDGDRVRLPRALIRQLFDEEPVTALEVTDLARVRADTDIALRPRREVE